MADYFMAVGPWTHWSHTQNNLPLQWGVKKDSRNSNFAIYEKLQIGDIVFIKESRKRTKHFGKNGIFGVAKVTRKFEERKIRYWPDEIIKKRVIYPYRFELDPIFLGKSDKDLIPWVKGLPYTKGLNHVVDEKPLKQLLNNANKKWKTKLEYTKIPFEVNEFYQKRDIWKKLKVGAQGGIRPNKSKNFVVIFLDAPTPNPKPGQAHNIYQDRFDFRTGLFHYTGAGQKGSQTLQGQNSWLVNANRKGSIIHFFRQYNFGGKHQYVGEVTVEKILTEKQPDTYGKNRKVYVFLLKPSSDVVLSEDDSINREIESELDFSPKRESKGKIIAKIKNLDKKTSKKGARKITKIIHSKDEYVRFKEIVKELRKLHYQKCQVCKTKHFAKKKGVYSEVHHLIPWAHNHNDESDNLVVVCANCHRKFHYAKVVEKKSMYRKLKPHFTGISYTIPVYV